MITQWKAAKNGNKWEPGQIVKVGFMRLRVLSARAEKDYLPDIYTLISLDGSKYYEFVPHNGLHRTDRVGHPCLRCQADSTLNGEGLCIGCGGRKVPTTLQEIFDLNLSREDERKAYVALIEIRTQGDR